ncbi:glycosyl transferase family 2 [Acerihabitans arboris]|uniref:Glycosyl transferase family 2 n=1 Tax=Acerihabitans arboris TaxID=2691583 RepID=A0A845SJJ2_9GAMM|nr:glycosyl transferase family 2 [Acerihabitans arboris]NDL63134.1 glycosyl transferase family 2 [Acerihabitans arboris]
MKNDSFVSVILNVDQQITGLDETLLQIQRTLDTHYSDYEIVIVAHGPFKISKFSNGAEAILQQIPSVRFIQLSGSVHHDVAWAAGLENAIGDFVVLFDPAADPISAISGIVDMCRSGTDVVVGVAKQPATPAYKLLRLISDRVLQAIDYHLPQHATTLRCISRRAVNSVTSTGRFHHQFYLRIQKTGYPIGIYSYQQRANSATKKTFWGGFRYLVRLMVFNSSRPLRWMSGIGMTGSLAAFIFTVYSVAVNIIRGHTVEGWTTTILFMAFLFMLQFIMLAFFGEYLGRLLDDRSEQADYSIAYEKRSAVMVNQDRVNVLSEPMNKTTNPEHTGQDS